MPEPIREIDLGFARVDVERLARCGRPEVIFAEGKTPREVAEIARGLSEAGQPVLATRAGPEHAAAVQDLLPQAVYRERCRCVMAGVPSPSGEKLVGVISAGTSDLPVAEECAAALGFFGHGSDLITDVGVAGLHRLLSRIEKIRSYRVLVVVAGMEGALPSVVAGLVRSPVIAVPTSVGYGAGVGGIAALLGMLSSCASGVVVVNIDNGFGAACAADKILQASIAG
ncbi:MAG: nickel pincer cofactor biosynthesis protein LarB [Terrimicrobiaceae bacterium]